jgi:hypothetical protein
LVAEIVTITPLCDSAKPLRLVCCAPIFLPYRSPKRGRSYTVACAKGRVDDEIDFGILSPSAWL